MIPLFRLPRLLSPNRLALLVVVGFVWALPWALRQFPSTLDNIAAACHDAAAADLNQHPSNIRFEDAVVSFHGKTNTGSAAGDATTQTGTFGFDCDAKLRQTWRPGAEATVTHIDLTAKS